MTDVLSEVLGECRVEGSVFCRFEAGRGWAVAYPAGDIAAFHLITAGTCVAEFEEAPGVTRRVALAAGDYVVFPHGDAHVLREAVPAGRGAAPVRIDQLVDMAQPAPRAAALTLGARAEGEAPTARYVCGAFRFADPRGSGVLGVLPRMLHVRPGAVPAEAGGPLGPWLETFLQAAACEAASGRPGGELVLARLSDVLFVHAVRAHLASVPPDAVGWLGALTDPAVGRALALLHGDPARAWTVAALAREVAMSRSRFAARFTALVGRPPLDYLAEWRMQRARGLLRGGRASVGEVAGRLGYRSEAAFSHAFRRRAGVPPGAYRRAQRSAAALEAVGAAPAA